MLRPGLEQYQFEVLSEEWSTASTTMGADGVRWEKASSSDAAGEADIYALKSWSIADADTALRKKECDINYASPSSRFEVEQPAGVAPPPSSPGSISPDGICLQPADSPAEGARGGGANGGGARRRRHRRQAVPGS